MRVDPAFHELYRREFGAVFRAAFLLCGDRQAAEDAAQEAFARALVRWRRLGDQPWVAGWVTTTAVNVARRSLRRRHAVPNERHQQIPDHDTSIDVRVAIRALPARQQEAVALHYLLDLSVEETAETMGVAQGTVKAHLARARQSLGEALGAPDVEPEDAPTRDPNHMQGEPSTPIHPQRRPTNG